MHEPERPEALNNLPLAHLAVAVERLDAAAPVYRALGFAISEAETIAREKVCARVASKGALHIELLEPAPAGEGPIAKFLAKRGPGLHHVALRTADLDGDLARLSAAGVAPLKGYPALGLGGSKVAFLDPKTTGGVLFELVQPAPGT
ncbi:MAG: VOC family protein [Planctomycetota bacterium]|nr:VOC family protein [Planctomycetota bacterium]